MAMAIKTMCLFFRNLIICFIAKRGVIKFSDEIFYFVFVSMSCFVADEGIAPRDESGVVYMVNVRESLLFCAPLRARGACRSRGECP